jgi:hypothetical protein
VFATQRQGELAGPFIASPACRDKSGASTFLLIAQRFDWCSHHPFKKPRWQGVCLGEVDFPIVPVWMYE